MNSGAVEWLKRVRPRLGPSFTVRLDMPGWVAPEGFPTDDRNIITARIRRADPDAPPPARVPSSREIARRKAKAEEAARTAAAAKALQGHVQRGLCPPPGRLCAVDIPGLMLIGSGGAIKTSERMVRTLEPLAAGGRHPIEVLISAGAWNDERSLREALAGIGGKLAAIGLRIDWRKAGLRLARAR